MIEELDDIIEEIANRVGAYGAHVEGEKQDCRNCFTSYLSRRIREATSDNNGHIGKQALKEMLRQMLANADEEESLRAQLAEAQRQRDEAMAQAAGYRAAIILAADELEKCRENHICAGPNCTLSDCTSLEDRVSELRRIITIPPSEHLPQLRAQAQADWLRSYLDGLSDGNQSAPGSMVAILRDELARLEGLAK